MHIPLSPGNRHDLPAPGLRRVRGVGRQRATPRLGGRKLPTCGPAPGRVCWQTTPRRPADPSSAFADCVTTRLEAGCTRLLVRLAPDLQLLLLDLLCLRLL